jgi:hypothetical protein
MVWDNWAIQTPQDSLLPHMPRHTATLALLLRQLPTPTSGDTTACRHHIHIGKHSQHEFITVPNMVWNNWAVPTSQNSTLLHMPRHTATRALLLRQLPTPTSGDTTAFRHHILENTQNMNAEQYPIWFGTTGPSKRHRTQPCYTCFVTLPHSPCCCGGCPPPPVATQLLVGTIYI